MVRPVKGRLKTHQQLPFFTSKDARTVAQNSELPSRALPYLFFTEYANR